VAGMGKWINLRKRLLPVLILGGIILAGCTPKRVVRTGGAAASPTGSPVPAQTSGSKPAELGTSGLPEPEYRGGAGSSSVKSATSSPPGEPARPQVTGSSLGLQAADLAQKQLGKPYQWGASGPEKFDCSGLVMYVYDSLGVPLPRVSAQQAYAGVHVDQKDLQPGDLVFFRLNGSGIDHVGIYVGHHKFVHAARKHMPVKTDSLNNSYWRRKFVGGRRLSSSG